MMVALATFEAALRAQLGYTEDPAGSNRTKFAALAGHVDGRPWCATFLSGEAKATGLELPSHSASTRVMAAAFQKVGAWGTKPKRGAFVFYNFEHTGIDHVEWVATTDPHGLVTIGGNTSPSSSGSQFNGGCVAIKHRPLGAVVGYGYPTYTTETPVAAPLKIVAVKAGSAENDLLNLYPKLFGDRDLWLVQGKTPAPSADAVGFGVEVDGGRWYVGKNRYETLTTALKGEGVVR